MHFIKDGKVLCGATHVRGDWTSIESHVTCDHCFAAIDAESEENVHLEDHTFGRSPVEISLAKILNEINNRRLASRVGGLMNRFDSIIKEVNKIERQSVKRYLLDVSKKDFFDLVDKMESNEKVKTHIKNAMTIRYRKSYNNETKEI